MIQVVKFVMIHIDKLLIHIHELAEESVMIHIDELIS